VRRIAAAALSLAFWTTAPAGAEDPFACAAAGQWIIPATGETMAASAVMALHSASPIVFLGESHGIADHHRWQLHTIAALHGRCPNMVLGVEMLPAALSQSSIAGSQVNSRPWRFLKLLNGTRSGASMPISTFPSFTSRACTGSRWLP
jgi:hypothetical protein